MELFKSMLPQIHPILDIMSQEVKGSARNPKVKQYGKMLENFESMTELFHLDFGKLDPELAEKLKKIKLIADKHKLFGIIGNAISKK